MHTENPRKPIFESSSVGIIKWFGARCNISDLFG